MSALRSTIFCVMTEKMYFDKKLWLEIFGQTKYFNQRPWDVASSQKIVKRIYLALEIASSQVQTGQITIEDFCYMKTFLYRSIESFEGE